ncbi:hypothetical protein DRN69_05405 [Candidatus Pacearchaeota archaeon]|nr:MAG: hypothetical protein DRN69_05405 [Candidatus Pacearchaeota archaeon]
MGNICVLYSGGLDSVLACAKLLEDPINRLTLLFIDTGYLWYTDLAKIQYQKLKERFGESVKKLVILDIRRLTKEYVVEKLPSYILEYKFNPVCLACKFLMYSVAIAYCNKMNIRTLADGVSRRQNELPEQRSRIVKWFDTYAWKYGVKLIHPVYEFENKNEVKYELMKYDIPQKSVEPICLFGNSFETNVDEDKLIKFLDNMESSFKEDMLKLLNSRWYIKKVIK